MGTLHDWFRVLAEGALWSAFTAWMTSGPLTLVKPPRPYLRMRILLCILSGIGFGLVDTFGGRAFHAPLLLLVIGITASMLVLDRLMRRIVRSMPQVQSYSSESPLFGQIDKKT
jgi:hypothetical protein